MKVTIEDIKNPYPQLDIIVITGVIEKAHSENTVSSEPFELSLERWMIDILREALTTQK